MMNENSSARMVDILTLETSGTDPVWIVWLLIPGLFFLLLYFSIRFYRMPIRRLHRQLVKNQLDARQAAHQLARMVELNPVQLSHLQNLRFAESEPAAQQVLDFIQKVRGV